MSIKQLPDSVIAQIKSSTTITSLNSAICGLVQNSLDAGATKIVISTDYTRGNCCVEDNGSGISPSEFQPEGGLGKLHYTSRYPPREDTHGKSGAFLASLSSLSLVSITSHHHLYPSHNTVRIHNSEVLARHIPSLPEQKLLSFDHGTRVTVRDLFGSMPVRVKQRAALTDKATTSRDWDQLKRSIVSLSIAWTGHVSISVRDSSSLQQFTIRGVENDGHSSTAVPFPLPAKVSKILYQSGMIEDCFPEDWVPLAASLGQLQFSGAVSLVPVATRRFQFISIGVQPLPNEYGSNILFEEINKLFANSSFGTEEEVEEIDDAEKSRRARDRRFKSDGFTNRELKTKKGVDRWPMFYLNLNIRNRNPGSLTTEIYELLDEQQVVLQPVVGLLRTMVHEFLRKHHFRPKTDKAPKDDAASELNKKAAHSKYVSRIRPARSASNSPIQFPTDRKSRAADLAVTRLNLKPLADNKTRTESPFDFWSRVKSGKRDDLSQKRSNVLQSTEMRSISSQIGNDLDVQNGANPLSSPHLLDEAGNLVRQPFLDNEPNNPGKQVSCNEDGEAEAPDECVECMDTISKPPALIDTPTRVAVQYNDRSGLQDDLSAHPLSKRLRVQIAPKESTDGNSWAGRLLSSWENAVFHPVEPPIPTTFGGTQTLSQVIADSTMNLSDRNLNFTRAGSNPVQGRLTRQALKNAEVIAQVDGKFILAKVPGACPTDKQIEHMGSIRSSLVVIDQHAADERCRVEKLMQDYFIPAVTDEDHVTATQETADTRELLRADVQVLEASLRFEISTAEMVLFQRLSKDFEHWGLFYKILPISASEPKQLEPGTPFLKVTHLPTSISERCQSDPRLVIELLRSEAWKLDEVRPSTLAENTRSVDGRVASSTGLHWLARFHDCPQGILDMINSKACRGAIMFNDILTLEECKSLLSRLADCVLPFQCAHGRPAMVPLVTLDERLNYNAFSGQETESFGKVFKRWKVASRGFTDGEERST